MIDNSEMSDYEEIKIPVEWGHISGKWWGPKNVQPILAMHGWLENCGTFDTLAPILASPETSILAIDSPGHGFSSHIPAGFFYYCIWDGILNIRRIVKHFKWPKVRLIGHSLGGAVSLMYAGIFPDEVDYIINVELSYPDMMELPKLLLRLGNHNDKFISTDDEKEKKSVTGSYEQMIRIVHKTYRGSITRTSTEILMRRGLKLVDRNKCADLYCFSMDPKVKMVDLGLPILESCVHYAKRITCGYLNIAAKDGIKSTYKTSHQFLVDAIQKVSSNFKCVTVNGTHHVHLSDPTDVALIIQDFIKPYPLITI